jgi:hypothetical protein
MNRVRSPEAAAVLAMLAAALLCTHAWAQAPVKTCAALRAELAAVPAFTAVNRLSGAGCLGEDRDPEPATARAQRLFRTAARVEGKQPTPKIGEVALSPEERRALTLNVLQNAHEYLGTVQSAASEADKGDVERLRGLVQQALRNRADGVEWGGRNPSFWAFEGGQDQLGSTGIDIRNLLARAGCNKAPPDAACAGAQATAEGLVRGATLAGRAHSVDQAQAIQAAAARAAVRDARWRSYFADARSQYPWELYVNSWRYESVLRKDGLSGPPSSQWILLHPDIGMQYVNSAASGDRFKPALLLELVGYNRWSWGDDHKPRNAWGGSISRTYADTASIPSGAWGLTIHYNNKYSATVSSVGGKTGLVLSLDLAGAVTSASQEWKDRLRLGQ